LQQTTRILFWPPMASERLRYLVPSAARMPRTVADAHAGTLTVMTFRIPASRGAFLLGTIKLNDIDLAVSLECPRNDVIKPSDGKLPATILTIPLGLVSVGILEPSVIVSGVWKADK